ncbi:MAG: ABC transporter ATP-binding protein [Coprothermobacterota bacterium]|jgi:branched-chain amino acid transport system ATP-binding protein|nr:ABC transporter ATP-binding protein [Coprothermobacterota bacterium]
MFALEIHDLHVSYGGIRALKGINFTVEPGKIVTIIGANGAGKSTTLRAISGLVPKQSGRVVLYGEDVTNTPAHKIVAMGVSHVPEGRRVFSTLTVLENLEIATYTRKDSKKFNESLELVFSLFPRLKERRKQLAGTLSGGEQQMLAVARGLMTGGKLMLLDEPSMGLAPVLVDEIFNTINKINQMGTTILLVEQNARMALENSHYAYVLEVGNIVLEGPSSEVKENPKVKEAYLGG